MTMVSRWFRVGRNKIGYYPAIVGAMVSCVMGYGEVTSPPEPLQDAAVVESVLMELLNGPKSPVETLTTATADRIFFADEAITRTITAKEILQSSTTKEWESLPTADLPSVVEAADNLVQRTGGPNPFQDFKPSDSRISVHTRADDSKDTRPRWLRHSPQVFRAYSPGYSADRQLAVVKLWFGWSGNFHSATATCIVKRQPDGKWSVVVRHIYFFV